jgi:hypothetical protein
MSEVAYDRYVLAEQINYSDVICELGMPHKNKD